MTETLKVKDDTKLEFDELQLAIRKEEGVKKTQDGLLKALLKFFKINYKKGVYNKE